MLPGFGRAACLLPIAALTALLPIPAALRAQDHIASPADLHGQIRLAQQERQENLARIHEFFASDLAKDAFKGAKLNPKKITEAVSVLSDSEVARLASQTDHVQRDFAAGRLTTQQVTYIILGAIAVAIILAISAAT